MTEIRNATRRVAVFAIVVALIVCTQRSSAHTMLKSKAILDEAVHLDAIVETLHRKGEFREAIPLAKRSLSLREKVLPPRHPDIAISLNNVARVYSAQGI